MYEHGYGIDKNADVAKRWFGRACDSGLQEGCDRYKEMDQDKD